YQQSHSKFFGFHSDSTFLFVLKIAKSIWFPFNDFQIIYEDPLSIMFLTVQSPVHLQGGSNDPVLPLLISEQNHRNPLPTFQCGYIPLHYIPSSQYTVPLHLIKMIRICAENLISIERQVTIFRIKIPKLIRKFYTQQFFSILNFCCRFSRCGRIKSAFFSQFHCIFIVFPTHPSLPPPHLI